MKLEQILSSCEHRCYQKGIKIPRDPDYPASAWGHYLPGDEPGNYCDITSFSCEIEDVPLEDCPKIKLTNTICLHCKEDTSQDIFLHKIQGSEYYICQVCQSIFSKNDLSIK